MSDLVDHTQIERIVGARRHPTEHIARGVSTEGVAYVLHSEECRTRHADLRDCRFSKALDRGEIWMPCDETVVVQVALGRLTAVAPCPEPYRIGGDHRTLPVHAGTEGEMTP